MYKYVAKYFLLERVYRFCNFFANKALLIGLFGFFIMSYICLFILPSDSVQSEVYRILFVHVPSAIMSELIYLFLAVNGFIYLVWRTKISAIFLNSAISIGLIFTALVLITGSIWGKPTWGTYWVWDARITSTFILFFNKYSIPPDAFLVGSFSAITTRENCFDFINLAHGDVLP